ncbi:ankyrin repeat domain-containing protein [Acanthopleuribacter pedis]|uniref:Ankyrin repeat domain-containing protein n=1 Tax=Acanthopleuribacter pedis TaxID=442870 RepID=A0A8J7QC53_9BACT|nr:ankyrin repeat domain-containing protein [Acanthopleuribacter pedis]MBO1323452.1 ankyrin repeat domain-containing protein [Acanthopleuribacter pedis]
MTQHTSQDEPNHETLTAKQVNDLLETQSAAEVKQQCAGRLSDRDLQKVNGLIQVEHLLTDTGRALPPIPAFKLPQNYQTMPLPGEAQVIRPVWRRFQAPIALAAAVLIAVLLLPTALQDGTTTGPAYRGTAEPTIAESIEQGDLAKIQSTFADVEALRAAAVDQTPMLHYAARVGQTKIVTWIIGQGLDVNQTDQQGKTPLMIAAEHGQGDTVTALLGLGADVTAQSADGQTAAALAEAYGYEEIAAQLNQPTGKPTN